MSTEVVTYVREIQAISAVPQILETVASLTGLGFVAIAHVTATSWTTCAVRDKLDFGLQVGDGLDVTTTLCDEVRSTAKTIVIDHVQESEHYRDHHTPRIYGFQSYFSVPIFRRDGSYFGTLCGLDPRPIRLTDPVTVSTMHLFAELISKQLDAEKRQNAVRTDLLSERETAELREQFIAVLGHDLRTPLGAIALGAELLDRKVEDAALRQVIERIRRSAARMAALVDDVMDFTRGRMGSGIPLKLRPHENVDLTLEQVVDEMRGLHPERTIVAAIPAGIALRCDPARLAQLLSNLLKNALVHGSADAPVGVTVRDDGGRFALAVTNAGQDIAPDVIGQLFKPYWRAASRPGSEGLGLGLYIVDQIARAHGGRIDVTSSGGHTSFTFTLDQAAPARNQ